MLTYNQITVRPNNIKAAGKAFDNDLPIEWQVNTQIDGIDPAMLIEIIKRAEQETFSFPRSAW